MIPDSTWMSMEAVSENEVYMWLYGRRYRLYTSPRISNDYLHRYNGFGAAVEGPQLVEVTFRLIPDEPPPPPPPEPKRTWGTTMGLRRPK